MKAFESLEKQSLLTVTQEDGDVVCLRDPKRAAMLSLLPGLGQLYNGQRSKGILFLAVVVINFALLVFSLLPGPILAGIAWIAGVFRFEISAAPVHTLLDSSSMAVALIYLGLFLGFVAYAVGDARNQAIRINRGLVATKDIGLPEAVSGSYMAHSAFMLICLLISCFSVSQAPQAEQATSIELVKPIPPPVIVEAPKPEVKKVLKPVEPSPKSVNPKTEAPTMKTPVAIAVPTNKPSDLAPAPVITPTQAMVPSSNTASGSGEPSAASGAASSQDIDYGGYVSAMQKKIKKAWFPPKGNESKRITVKFKLNKNGDVSRIRLIESSGLAIADEAASNAVEQAAPFGPLPEGSPESIEIKFTFDYSIFGGSGAAAM